VSASAALLRDTWPWDEAVCLTFMLALGSNARPQEGDSSTTAVWRRNLITLTAQLALSAGHSRVVRAVGGEKLLGFRGFATTKNAESGVRLGLMRLVVEVALIGGHGRMSSGDSEP
jgi:hypothetical protein